VALLVIASLYAGALVRGARQAARRLYLGQLALALAFVAGSVAQAGLGRSGRIAALAAVVLLAGYLAERLAPGVPTSTERKPGRAGVSIVFEVTYCVAAAITAVLGMFVGGMRCDEGCSSAGPGVDWTDLRDAWQWEALTTASVVLFFAALLFAATVGGIRRSRWPLVAYAFQLGASVIGLAILASGWASVQLAIPILWLAGTQALAVAAIVLRRGSAGTTRSSPSSTSA
jgi:hypothetical protein